MSIDPKVTRVSVIVIFLGIIAWDIVLGATKSETISQFIWQQDHPMIPFIGGLIVGHFWWRK